MRRLLLVAVLSAVLLPVSACLAEGRIGFVNASAVFEQYSAAREAQQAYEKEMSELNVQVEAMERDIKAAAETLEARKYLFSEERLKEKELELERKQQDYVKFRQDAEAKAARRNEELTKPIVGSIEQAAKTVAEKDGFDLVLDAAAGIVVYSKPELDLTDRVLQELEQSKQSGETSGGQ
jgi:outer membrane protein